MSYILDALKKAERERGIAQVPTLSTVHELRAKPPFRLWAASGFVVLCLAVLFGIFFFGLDGDDDVKPPSAEGIGNAANLPGQNQAPSTMPANEPSSGLPSSEFRAAPDAVYSRDIPAPVDEAKKEIPVAEVQEPAVDEGRVPQPDRAATAARPDGVASDVSPRESTERLPARPPVTAAQSEEPKPSVNGETSGGKVSLREAMNKMEISILLYSENEAERLVFINGRKYVEGDVIEGNYILEQITPEGAVLSCEGERAILRPGRN